jgi:hypothetical protein
MVMKRNMGERKRENVGIDEHNMLRGRRGRIEGKKAC